MSFGNFEGPLETINDAQQRDKIRKYVIEYLLRAQDKAVRLEDRDFNPQPGDRVYLSSEHVDVPGDKRLKPRWLGPYVVLARDENLWAVNVELPLKWRVENPIALSRLKPCHNSDLPPVEILEDSDGNKYVEAEVEKIISHGEKGRRPHRFVSELNVRFLGYSEEFDHCYEGRELIELLRTAPLVVQDYLSKNGLRLAPAARKVLLDSLKE